MNVDKIAVSLPKETLRSLESARLRLRRSRSAVVAEAVAEWLAAHGESDAERKYVEGYRRHPETPRETAARAAAAAAVVATWEPWE
jgi:metal-responsive CopG/Arc/MetJ family transcriptional regulator